MGSARVAGREQCESPTQGGEAERKNELPVGRQRKKPRTGNAKRREAPLMDDPRAEKSQ